MKVRLHRSIFVLSAGLGAFSMAWCQQFTTIDFPGATVTNVRGINPIKEIYVFDANGWAARQRDPSDILTTASQTGDLRLRVVAATSRAANLASFPAAKLTRSAHPDFKADRFKFAYRFS